MKLLDILIPTYNRKSAVIKNINRLVKYIEEYNLSEDVGIIIYDNHSPDDTFNVLCDNYSLSKENISLFSQKKNVGLEQNAVDILAKSSAEYVMFLGDDDYIQKEYLNVVIDNIRSNKDISCIIPSWIAKTISNKTIAYRDIGENKYYQKGIKSVIELFTKGHQLSGVTFLREATLDKYLEYPTLRNLYLFMFFVGFNCMRGDAIHLTEYPVKVTLGEKKDWNYGSHGLSIDKIKNIKILFRDKPIYRFRLENTVFIESIQSINVIYGRLNQKIYALILVCFSRELSILYKMYIPLCLVLFIVKKIINHLFLIVKIK